MDENEYLKDKSKRATRRHNTDKKIDRQMKIYTGHVNGNEQFDKDKRHRFHKKHAWNCGNPNCVMCMNPRKAWGDGTMQEKSFEQTKKWNEND